jgi:P-type conjugative transfer ATPase TrbB
MNDYLKEIIKVNIGELLPYFNDDSTEDILVNPDGMVWVNQKGKGEYCTDIYLKPSQRLDFISIIADEVHKNISAKEPVLTAVLPEWGYRIEAHIPPSVEEAAFAIRIGGKVAMSLDDYVAADIMTAEDCKVIRNAITEKKNILVAGGTGSGKTTLTNAILNEFAGSSERFVILEDTRELRCPAKNKYNLCSSEHTTLQELFESTLRLFPNRIVIGEIRKGPIAYDFLNASISGHPGCITTLHADGPLDALLRLQLMLLQVFKQPQPEFIARAVDMVIFIERVGLTRKVSSIGMCKGHHYDANNNSIYEVDYYK